MLLPEGSACCEAMLHGIAHRSPRGLSYTAFVLIDEDPRAAERTELEA
jgi:hypothetical protein